MCLSIPSKVVSIDHENNSATVETMGIQRVSSLALMEEGTVTVGDYVLLHIGFIMNKIDEEDAIESLSVYQSILEKLDEDERRQVVIDDDHCPNREVV